MRVYSVDKSNINDFDFLFNDDATRRIKADESSGFVIWNGSAHVGGLYGVFTSPGEFSILSFYVLPEARRQGVGTYMLESLYEILGNIDVSVTINFTAVGEDGKALAEFFEKQGYDDYLDANNSVFYTTIAKLKEIKLKVNSKKIKYVTFRDTPMFALKEFLNASKGFTPIPEGGVDGPSVLKELSFTMYDGGSICGFAICEGLNDDNIMLSSIYVKKRVAPIALTGLLGTLVSSVQKHYPEHSGLVIPCINEDSRRLVETLFAEEDIEEVSANYTKRLTSQTDYSGVPLTDFLEDERGYLYGESEEGDYLTEVEPFIVTGLPQNEA